MTRWHWRKGSGERTGYVLQVAGGVGSFVVTIRGLEWNARHDGDLIGRYATSNEAMNCCELLAARLGGRPATDG